MKSNKSKKTATDSTRLSAPQQQLHQQLPRNSNSSRSSSGTNGNTTGNASTTKMPNHSGYNMAYIQTTIRRTMVVIVIFALLVRLQMLFGSRYFIQRPPTPTLNDHVVAAANAKRHSTSRRLISEQRRVSTTTDVDTAFDPSAVHAILADEEQ